MSDTVAEIHRLSERRQELWRDGEETSAAEVARITVRLHDLYALKREEAARRRGADSRARIMRRARTAAQSDRALERYVRTRAKSRR